MSVKNVDSGRDLREAILMSKKTVRSSSGVMAGRPPASGGWVVSGSSSCRSGSVFGSLTMPNGTKIRTMDERVFRDALSQSKDKK